MVIRRGKVRVAVLVRAPEPAGKRNIWGSLEGSMPHDFDEVPADFKALR